MPAGDPDPLPNTVTVTYRRQGRSQRIRRLATDEPLREPVPAVITVDEDG